MCVCVCVCVCVYVCVYPVIHWYPGETGPGTPVDIQIHAGQVPYIK
jgi:hypothetical protein